MLHRVLASFCLLTLGACYVDNLTAGRRTLNSSSKRITSGCGFHIYELVKQRMELTLLQQGSVEPRICVCAVS